MKKIHFTDRYLLNPRHPVTVFVIGAGGTGSQVITNLARMNMALQALGHPGLHVTVFDPDTVTVSSDTHGLPNRNVFPRRNFQDMIQPTYLLPARTIYVHVLRFGSS